MKDSDYKTHDMVKYKGYEFVKLPTGRWGIWIGDVFENMCIGIQPNLKKCREFVDKKKFNH